MAHHPHAAPDFASPWNINAGEQQIIATLQRRRKLMRRQQSEIGDSYHPHTRIAINAAKCEQLLDIGAGHISFIAQDTFGRRIDRFINMHESTGQGPWSAADAVVPPYQQDG